VSVDRFGSRAIAVDAAARRAAGRGAYVCPEEACIERALRSGSLRRALRAESPLPDGVTEELQRMVPRRRDG
jgi:predicted RNA-binding protein YlxR (DUF448 family)